MENNQVKTTSFKLKTAILAFLVVTVWGLTFISFKVAGAHFTSPQIMLLRTIIAYISLWIIYPKKHKSEGKKQELLLFLAGLCGTTLYVILTNEALRRTATANVSVFSSISPIWTALLLPLFFRNEKLSVKVIIGFVIATVGAAFVSTGGNFNLSFSFFGDALAIGSGIIWAVYSILLRLIKSQYPQLYITRRIFLYGIITVIPILIIQGTPLNMEALKQWDVILNLLFLGLVAYTFAHIGWAVSIKRMGSVWTSQFSYIEPIITMVFSFLILSEKITLPMVIGTVLILLGVAVADGKILSLLSGKKKEEIG